MSVATLHLAFYPYGTGAVVVKAVVVFSAEKTYYARDKKDECWMRKVNFGSWWEKSMMMLALLLLSLGRKNCVEKCHFFGSQLLFGSIAASQSMNRGDLKL